MLKSLFIYSVSILTKLLPGAPFRLARRWLWSLAGVELAPTVNVMPGAVFSFGVPGTKIVVGDSTFIGFQSMVMGGDIQIGDNCDLAPRCILHAGTHRMGSNIRRAGDSISGRIAVGSGTWIGTGAIVLANAEIGKSCIVAAGSVVLAGCYPDNVLLAGNPAVVKKTLS